MFSVVAGAQVGLTFDRPGITDLYCIVPNKSFQVEGGYDFINFYKIQDKLPSITVRKSFSKRFELRYVYDYASYSTSLLKHYEKTDLLVHALGTKINLFENTKKMLGISAIITTKAANKAYLNKRYYGVDAFIVIQKQWGKFEYTNNTGVLLESFGINTRYMLGNCFSYLATKRKAIFVEQYIFYTPTDGKGNEFGLIGGYTYQTGTRYQFDLSAGIMDFDNGYWFAGTGFSIYLGKL